MKKFLHKNNNMKRIILIFLGLFSLAYGQFSNTGAKTRFVNGISIGTKLDSYFNAADSNAIYWRADSVLRAKYRGMARTLAFIDNLADSLVWGNITGSLNNQTDLRDTLATKVRYIDTAAMLRPYKKLPVIAWGNSLTEGTGATSSDSTWVSQASRYTGYNFVNKGVAGETSSQILTRVYAESADTLVFPAVFWAMENNTDTSVMTSSLDSFVAKINHNRWVAVAPLLRSGNPIGNQVYDEQRKWTYDATRRYGNHIIDLQYWLLNFGDGSSQDNTDIANGVIPSSLRVDNIHLNDKGYRIAAQRIIQQLAFFTQGDNTYTNSLSISARQGTPILNGNGLFAWKNNNHSYINSVSSVTPYSGGDTLTLQNSNGVLDLLPSSGNLRIGFVPVESGGNDRILMRGSLSDTSQIVYASRGTISSTDLSVTNGTNSTIGKNVVIDLATANNSPGLYGDSVTVPQFNVTSKGLVTGVINKPIPTASASLRGLLSSSDWSTFNSKIGGSGTTSYVPKFSGSSTLSNSLIYDAGSEIIINGTTSEAGYPLQVNGLSAFGTYGSARVYAGTLSATKAYIQAKDLSTARNLDIFADTLSLDNPNLTQIKYSITKSVATQANTFSSGATLDFTAQFWSITTGTTPTVTIPSASGHNRILTIRSAGAVSGNLTISTGGGNIIDKSSSASTLALASGSVIMLQSDGTDWIVLSKY